MRDRTARLAALPLLATVLGLPAAGQTPPSPPAAQPAPQQPQGCTAPEHRQFDFWLGEWNVTLPDGKQAGTNRIESLHRGCVLQESWAGTGGVTGTSVNIYTPADKKWHQAWVDSGGSILLLVGGLQGSKMVMSGESPSDSDPTKTVLQRITWDPLAPDKVRQLWESSEDGGKTWTVAFDGTYSRKR